MKYFLCLVAFGLATLTFDRAWADDVPAATPDEAVSTPEAVSDAPATESQSSPEGKSTISKPSEGPREETAAPQAPSSNPKPSQGEGEKAPVQSRPTAVPEFSLPEVVITGENELTIGAKRLDRRENDVTLGSHDLTGIDRAFNDLPGLSKTFTALTAEEAGPSKDTALVLHLGGGTPNTYGGWGLFGQQFTDFQYLLSGFYSTWGGLATAGGLDGDRKYYGDLDARIFPSSPLSLSLSADLAQTDAELPYQGSMRELHQSLTQIGGLRWKISNSTQAQLTVSNQSTTLTYWDQTEKTNETQELEGRLKFTADELDPFLNSLSAEVGGRKASSDFTAPFITGYDWEWMGLQTTLKQGESLLLVAKVQGQKGNGLDMPLKFFPVLDFTWRFFGKSQLNLYWRTDRYVDSFHNAFMNTEHVSPEGGFPLPTEVTNEFGGRFTQKISEKIIASVSASSAQLLDYHQWTDITPANPANIQDYSTLAQIQLNKAGANVQWNFAPNWQAAGTYQWTQGVNNSGDGKNFTNLPMHKGVLSLYRGDETLETRVDLQGFSERLAYDTGSVTLPAYATLGLDATYHFSKTFSLWLNGDNLLGQAYRVQLGYLEPQFHVRGGIEIIF